jgi:hydrogenase maturation protease
MGNVLMGDDALGPHVARLLDARYVTPPDVDIEDVGTPGLDLTPYLDGARAVIVIDTVVADGAPGTIRTYRRDELLASPPPDRTSPHQPGLRESLMASELTSGMPEEVILVGVVPQDTEARTGLSPALRDRLDDVVRTVVTHLETLGVSLEHRNPPEQPDLWWE